MTPAQLFALLVALPALHDGHGRPIRRPEGAAKAIVEVVATDSEDPRDAVTLDVLMAHESGYHLDALGDSGQSCGPLQTPCALLPLHAPPHAYIRLALRILRASPCAHPLYSYASGRCAPTPVAVRYEREVEANVARARVLAASLEAAP